MPLLPKGQLISSKADVQIQLANGGYVPDIAVTQSLKIEPIGPTPQIVVNDVADAVTLPVLEELMGAGTASSSAAWIPLEDIPLPFSQFVTDTKQERRINNGQTVLIRESDSAEGDWIRLLTSRGKLLAVGTVVERIGTGRVGVIQPRIVFK